MVDVEWFVGSVVGLCALNYATARLLLREVHALTRALIANNSKDLIMLEKHTPETKRFISPRKRPAEQTTDFTETTPRVMGL